MKRIVIRLPRTRHRLIRRGARKRPWRNFDARLAGGAFSALIDSPADGQFTMPAAGKLRFVATNGASAGDTCATLVGTFYSYADVGGVITRVALTDRTLKTPDLEENQSLQIDFVEQGVVVIPEAGFDVQLAIEGVDGDWATISTHMGPDGAVIGDEEGGILGDEEGGVIGDEVQP